MGCQEFFHAIGFLIIEVHRAVHVDGQWTAAAAAADAYNVYWRQIDAPPSQGSEGQLLLPDLFIRFHTVWRSL